MCKPRHVWLGHKSTIPLSQERASHSLCGAWWLADCSSVCFVPKAGMQRREVKEKNSQFRSLGRSYRLIQSLRERRATGGGDLPADCVGVVLAAAARTFQTIVALLAKFEAPQGREVAAEAGHEEREEAHSSPAGAAGPRAAGAGVISTGVLIVSGAMVEETLDTAQASPIVDETLWGAEAALVADPAGGQAASGCAAGTLATPTLLADEEVSRVEGGLLHHTFQWFLRLQVACSGLCPDEGVPRM